MRHKYDMAIAVIFCAMILCGCGNKVPLKGKVTFSDDGSPLPMGCVNFRSESYAGRGNIKADGQYIVGSERKADGILPGKYRVYISGAFTISGKDRFGEPIDELLIDRKYTSPSTSGLEIEITKQTRRFDIVVDRPGPARKQ